MPLTPSVFVVALAVKLPILLLETLLVVPADIRIPLIIVLAPLQAVVILQITFFEIVLVVPPDISIPSMVGLTALVAAPTETPEMELLLIVFVEPLEIDIPLTLGAEVSIPLKFKLLMILFEMVLAPVLAFDIPTIDVGEVALEVNETVFPEIVFATPLEFPVMPVMVGAAEVMVIELPLTKSVELYATVIAAVVPL